MSDRARLFVAEWLRSNLTKPIVVENAEEPIVDQLAKRLQKCALLDGLLLSEIEEEIDLKSVIGSMLSENDISKPSNL